VAPSSAITLPQPPDLNLGSAECMRPALHSPRLPFTVPAAAGSRMWLDWRQPVAIVTIFFTLACIHVVSTLLVDAAQYAELIA
jgi:hypothetical protein